MSTTERNKEIVRAWFERVWNARDASAMEEIRTTRTTSHGLGREPFGGIEGFRRFHAVCMEVLSECRVDIDDLVAEGDKVAVRARFSGNCHGKRFEVTGACFCRLEDGKLVETWNQWDLNAFLSQLGSGSGSSFESALLNLRAR